MVDAFYPLLQCDELRLCVRLRLPCGGCRARREEPALSRAQSRAAEGASAKEGRSALDLRGLAEHRVAKERRPTRTCLGLVAKQIGGGGRRCCGTPEETT